MGFKRLKRKCKHQSFRFAANLLKRFEGIPRLKSRSLLVGFFEIDHRSATVPLKLENIRRGSLEAPGEDGNQRKGQNQNTKEGRIPGDLWHLL